MKPTLTDFLEAGEDPECANCGHAGSLHGNDDGSCTNERVTMSGLFPDCDCPDFELGDEVLP